jgi:hypothetical protein
MNRFRYVDSLRNGRGSSLGFRSRVSADAQARRLMLWADALLVPGVEAPVVEDGLPGSSRLWRIASKLLLSLLLDELCELLDELLWLDPWPP